MIMSPGLFAYDANCLVENMHPDDRAEAEAMGVRDTVTEVLGYASRSSECFNGTHCGRILLACGVIDETDSPWLRKGGVWLVTTKESRDHPVAFAREARRTTNRWKLDYHLLTLYVHSRHEHGRKLAEFCGFKAVDVIDTPAGDMFAVYEWRAA